MRNGQYVWVHRRSCLLEGFVFFFFLFSHARIGLLIQPGRETEKLIIVPLRWTKSLSYGLQPWQQTVPHNLCTQFSFRNTWLHGSYYGKVSD